MRPWVPLLLLLVVLVCAPAAGAAKPRLKPFGSCSALIAYGNRHAPTYAPASPVAARPLPMAGTEGATTTPGAPVAADDVSGTNNQEAGVDEADTVKTDGRTIWSVGFDGTLRAVDANGDAPRLLSTLPLGDTGSDHELLRDGDRLLVVSTRFPMLDAVAAIAPFPGGQPRTHLDLVDASDPGHPVVRRTLDADGRVLAARQTGRTIRVVLAATPRSYVEPQAVSRAHANAWLPAGTYRRASTGRKRRALVGCRAVRRPRAFSGLDTVTVLTFDLDRGLEPVDSDGVMAGGETVYASPDSLYVASRRYVEGLEGRTDGDAPAGMTTEIHRFETAGATTTYRGSGTVPGYLLSQFALSERGGVLRVAGTDIPPWFAGTPQSHSGVTTLKVADGALPRLGRVSGLGAGERIYAVRFEGDAGYVVTFRQVDPLFTIDLSDPASPRVAGELPLLGYSAYLHPLGGGRLLGVGRDATATGVSTGAAVSLFDVSDLAHPKLLSRATVPDGFSDVEWDHHAFLWWPRTALAVIPVSSGDFSGAIGYGVGDAVVERGRIAQSGVTRTLVVGDRLYTVSPGGVAASRLDTLAPIAFAPFGRRRR